LSHRPCNVGRGTGNRNRHGIWRVRHGIGERVVDAPLAATTLDLTAADLAFAVTTAALTAATLTSAALPAAPLPAAVLPAAAFASSLPTTLASPALSAADVVHQYVRARSEPSVPGWWPWLPD